MITSILTVVATALFAPTGSTAPVRPAPAYAAPVATYGTVDPGAPILEDSPLWDCRVHGNRICGPGATVPVPIGPDAVILVPWDLAPAPVTR